MQDARALTPSELDPFGPAITRGVQSQRGTFIGRDWLAGLLRDELRKADAAARQPNAPPAASLARGRAAWVVIYGNSGTGKTSFLRRLLDPEACAAPPWASLHGPPQACFTSLGWSGRRGSLDLHLLLRCGGPYGRR